MLALLHVHSHGAIGGSIFPLQLKLVRLSLYLSSLKSLWFVSTPPVLKYSTTPESGREFRSAHSTSVHFTVTLHKACKDICLLRMNFRNLKKGTSVHKILCQLKLLIKEKATRVFPTFIAKDCHNYLMW